MYEHHTIQNEDEEMGTSGVEPQEDGLQAVDAGQVGLQPRLQANRVLLLPSCQVSHFERQQKEMKPPKQWLNSRQEKLDTANTRNTLLESIKR
jgi:hypothetical protein